MVVFISCKSSPETGNDKEPGNWNKANIVQVDPTDSIYRQQLKNAQDSIGFFVALLKEKNKNHFDFFAKPDLLTAIMLNTYGFRPTAWLAIKLLVF
ncbi:hypothetical protein KRR40_14765 [Niabella defluvii]|nr:hypothetical protein KRR40_14765 [Niabella sp. I65]